MVHGNKKKNDQIANGSGKRGPANRQSGSACLFVPLLTQRFYPAPVICYSCFAAVPEDRLSWHHPNAYRLLRAKQRLGAKKNTALLNFMLCREKAAKKRAFEDLLKAIFSHAGSLGLLETNPQGAIDATGLESRYVSQYFVECTKRPSYFRRSWPKVTLVCDTKTHLIAGCIVTKGPSHDCPNLRKAMAQADKQIKFGQLLADGGFDSEANHRFCREVLGIDSTLIAYNPRGFKSPPSGKYRRQMVGKFDKKSYNNRWQVESVISRNKRLLGSALRSRNEDSRKRECLIRVLTHNLMIIRRAA